MTATSMTAISLLRKTVGSVKFDSSPSAGLRWTHGLSGELKPALSLSDPLTVVLQKTSMRPFVRRGLDERVGT